MIVFAGICRGKLAVLELSDRLRNSRRRRTEHLHALHGERAQDDAADASAQHGVEVHVLFVAGLRFTQGHRTDAAALGIEKGKKRRVRQMRFDL